MHVSTSITVSFALPAGSTRFNIASIPWLCTYNIGQGVTTREPIYWSQIYWSQIGDNLSKPQLSYQQLDHLIADSIMSAAMPCCHLPHL